MGRRFLGADDRFDQEYTEKNPRERLRDIEGASNIDPPDRMYDQQQKFDLRIC